MKIKDLIIRLFATSVMVSAIAGCSGALTASNSKSADELEAMSGGPGTVIDATSDAFGHVRTDISTEDAAKFDSGRSFFRQNWVVAGDAAEGRDGLGPIMNATSCAACHFNDGRSAPPNAGEPFVALLLRLSVEGDGPHGGPKPHPIYGDQIQNSAILGVKPEATPKLTFSSVTGTFDDGSTYALQKPSISIENANYGETGPVSISPRTAPPVIGMGLLELIPESVILAMADSSDSNHDGIKGRPNYVWNESTRSTTIGRFGWKANQPSVLQQVSAAFSGDIGITSPMFPSENYSETEANLGLAQFPTGGNPEATALVIDRVTAYTKSLAVPARRDIKNTEVIRGKQLFTQLNCAGCHRPEVPTPIGTIRPFTDLLLHDMGPDLADNRSDFDASGSEWRTPPLWGIGLTQKVNGHTRFLHDGRARNLEEAVLWHGGEAERSQLNYKKLSQSDRKALIAFLSSL